MTSISRIHCGHFTKGVLKRKKFEVMYCPTNKMVEDFYIKPLQGGQLYRLQDVIMGKHKTMLPVECVETDRDNVRKLVNTSDG